jgi:hypothetical protein
MIPVRKLVGEEPTPEELSRLQHVHDLLVAAPPPPELSSHLANPPAVTRAGYEGGGGK